MRDLWRTFGARLGALSIMVAAAAVAPAPLRAQEPAAGAEASEPEVDREHMTRFVRAHIATNEARDEFHGEVARVHDEEGRIRAREKVEATIDGILEAEEMTREEFDELTLMISLDGDLRALFDEILAQLQEERSGGG